MSLMLSKGRYDWFSPSIFLSPTAASVLQKLTKGTELPTIPTAVMELQKQLRDETNPPASIATALKSNPILAGQVLKIANNLKIGSGQKINSIEHAIVFVGRKTVADLTQVAAMKSFSLKTKKFQAEKFWTEAMITGVITEQLVRLLNLRILPDEAYLAGTMCNIGKIVGAITSPDITDKVYDHVTQSKTLPSWSQAEKEMGAIDHCVLGEIGAVVWGMPQYVKAAAMKHHSPLEGAVTRTSLGIPDLVVLANQLTHWVLLNPNRIDKSLLDKTAKQMRLSDGDLQKFVNDMIKLSKSQLSDPKTTAA